MNWEYIKDRGIKSSDSKIEIYFDTKKEEIDKVLLPNSITSQGRSINEYCYSNIFESGLDIRLNFDDGLLSEIEVLEGAVFISGVNVQIERSIKLATLKLRVKGHRYFKHTNGYTFPNLKIDLGDQYKNGGERSVVCWIYTAKNIEHLFDDQS
ncbi:MAG: hypothetical protein COA86_18745 [Kangiella sp.]|nr:MAG: hypothetical protein COA86_18745 [Kangiella sp.]